MSERKCPICGTWFEPEKKCNGISRIYLLEREKLKRQYFREKRIKNGIIEPVIKCRKCKEEKPLFEFPPQWSATQFKHYSDLNKLFCYDCLSIIEETKKCPKCRLYREKEYFEDNGYSYENCLICRDKDKAREELYYKTVSDQICRHSLALRNIKETEESIVFIRELLMAQRLNKKVKNILKKGTLNESNYPNV